MTRRPWLGLDPARAVTLALTVAAIVALWSTPLLVPLKLLVVLFHELSHALAAWATGGRVLGVAVGPRQFGMTTTAGGIRWVIASAGYLGSLGWGVALVVAGRWPRLARPAAAALGLLLIGLGVAWVRPVVGLALPLTLGTAAALLTLAWRAPGSVVGAVLHVVGVTSCLYALHDLHTDVLAHPGQMSDAVKLARHTGVPALAWGSVWMAVALGVTAVTAWFACRADPAPALPDPASAPR